MVSVIDPRIIPACGENDNLWPRIDNPVLIVPPIGMKSMTGLRITAISAAHLALGIPSHAGAGLFDWESGASCAARWEADGLRVTNARGTICADLNGTVSNGTSSSNDVAGLTISHVNGLIFTPESIDLAEYSALFADEVISFFGTKADGAIVSTTVALDGVIDGAGGVDDFQQFVFPADFADIIRLEVPNSTWRFDNLRFKTIIPPPLPPDPRLNSGFLSANLLYSKSIHDNTLVIGEDFQFVSGFNQTSPTRTKFIPPEGSGFHGSTPSVHYDRADQALYFKSTTSTALKKIKTGTISDVVTLADMAAAGFPEIGSLSMPRAAGGRLLFLDAGVHNEVGFSIFKLQNGTITTVVTPQTVLPDGKLGATPRYSPSDLVVNANDFAFDTSLQTSLSIRRLYASFGGATIQQVLSTHQPISWQGSLLSVKSFSEFGFTENGELRVRARLSTANAWLHFTNAGLVRVAEIDTFAKPENAGKNVSGELVETASGVTFLKTQDEIYREYEGRFYRVAGVGDRIGGEAISMVEFKVAPANPPLRAIVEVRYESSPGSTHLFELLLDEPRSLAPWFGGSFVHPESGHLFVPLSQLTLGHSYWLQSSGNLVDWTDIERIESVEALQHVVIPPALLASPSFFRVEDRP